MGDKKDERRGRRAAAKPQNRNAGHRVADEPVADAKALGATVQNPTTETGLLVEEQVRKEWDPKKDGGLPIPLHDEAQ